MTGPSGLGAISVHDGRLYVESCDVTELARHHGTPCYVVSEAQLRANARRITAAFGAAWPHGPVEVLPAFKAALSLAVRAILTDEGLGCDAFGAPELRAALGVGVPGERISVNGPCKDVATFAAAIAAGATVTLDGAGELEALREAASAADRPARVHLRLRPDYARITAPSDFSAQGESVAHVAHAYKPGVAPEQAVGLAARIVAEPGLELTGLMVHLGRHRADLQTWGLMACAVADAVGSLVARLDGWLPRELDLGGGFPAPRDPLRRAPGDDGSLEPVAPPIEELAEVIATELAHGLSAAGVSPDGLVLQVERSLTFYRDGLGLAILQRGVETDERIGAVLALPGARLRFADLALGDGTVVELLEYQSPPGRALRPQPNDPGAAHAAFVVDDIDEALRRLRTHGFPSRSSPVLLNDHDGRWKDVRIAYVHDPDGFIIELIQRPDDSRPG